METNRNFFSALAATVIVCALCYGGLALTHINTILAQQITSIKDQAQAQSISMQDTLATMQNAINTLQQQTKDYQTLLAPERRQVIAALSLVKLARQHIQVTGNLALANNLLQDADQIIKQLNNSRTLTIHQALTTDIATIQTLAHVDITALYAKMSALSMQIDTLPLASGLTNATAEPTIDRDHPAALTQTEVTSNTTQPWWKRSVEHSNEVLRKIIVVRHHADNTLSLILPEEKILLSQVLHAQFENALWAILHRNTDIYQASLSRAQQLISRYFLQDSVATTTMLASLTELKKISLPVLSLSLTATINAFDSYLK